MGLFNIFKKTTATDKDKLTNVIYELLFCDNLDLYKSNSKQPQIYPWNILFADDQDALLLDKIISDDKTETRAKILAYNRLISLGEKPDRKELLAIIVEIGLDNGLDVLASYNDGSARYINQTGEIIVWETRDEQSNLLIANLFNSGLNVIKQIGPWHKPRLAAPAKGVARLTFLVSDGLYFGEAPVNVFFSDPLAGPTLATAAELMKYLIEKAT